MTLWQLLKTTKGNDVHLLELALEWGYSWGDAMDTLEMIEGVKHERTRIMGSIKINQAAMS